KLLRGELTGIDCAAGFINSNEYQNLNLSNEDYIRNMYRTFLGREADETGFNDWVSQLENGNTRDEIFAGFANSVEFQSICDGYGIVRGDYTAQDVGEVHRWRLVRENYSSVQNTADGDIPAQEWSKEYEYFAGTDDVRKTASIYSYGTTFEEWDEQGRKISETYSNDPDFCLVPENVTDTRYELVNPNASEGQRERWIYEKLQDGKWHEVFEGQTFKFDEKNRLVESSTDEALYGLAFKENYEYNGPKGQLSKWISSSVFEGNEKVQQVITYEYDNNGVIIGEKDIWYQPWGPLESVRSYEYDEYGRLSKMIYRSEGETGANYEKVYFTETTTYEYEEY
ncbi:MAG: DUF4214 domain-containing protein, partial [Lachnospiraceae bacterium]|nr:DUF4214 domain-containing protein [Lachnospiraceae bacterium]